jgi:molybdate transport system substrate-binding protein
VGRIGVGVAVRDGAPIPKVATVDEFKQSLLSAESIVYNQASTGIYLESLFERLGISAQLKAKTTRYADFAAVRDHVSKGTVNEIGLGATTVIIESAGKGLKFAGPLPAEIQTYTTYAATVPVDSPARDAAVALLQYLGSHKAKTIFASVGIE